MSRCPYLEYESHSLFGSSNDEFICKLSGRHFSTNSDTVKFLCKGEYDNDDHYKECQIYKDRRW